MARTYVGMAPAPRLALLGEAGAGDASGSHTLNPSLADSNDREKRLQDARRLKFGGVVAWWDK